MSSATKRAKLDSFFGSSSGTKAKKSRDLEDPVDIYDHTKSFFKDSAHKDHEVDVGERKLRAKLDEADFDEVVYGGKKVSRKQL